MAFWLYCSLAKSTVACRRLRPTWRVERCSGAVSVGHERLVEACVVLGSGGMVLGVVTARVYWVGWCHGLSACCRGWDGPGTRGGAGEDWDTVWGGWRADGGRRKAVGGCWLDAGLAGHGGAAGGEGGLLACHGIRLLSAGGYYTCTAQCCSLPVPSLSSLPCIGCVAFWLSVPVSSWVTAHTLRSIPCVLAGYLPRAPLVGCNRRKRVRVAVYLGV